MGLDSVELVMEVEKFFGIRIPDSEAEKISTVGQMVGSVANHLDINYDGIELKLEVFNLIVQATNKCNSANEPIHITDQISKHIFWRDKEWWKRFRNSLNLKIPTPDRFKFHNSKIASQLLSLVAWKPNYDSESLSFEQFTTAICGSNYESLVSKNTITSKYEIYVAVIGIVVDKVGVDFYEVSPEKSFTDDLGID